LQQQWLEKNAKKLLGGEKNGTKRKRANWNQGNQKGTKKAKDKRNSMNRGRELEHPARAKNI